MKIAKRAKKRNAKTPTPTTATLTAKQTTTKLNEEDRRWYERQRRHSLILLPGERSIHAWGIIYRDPECSQIQNDVFTTRQKARDRCSVLNKTSKEYLGHHKGKKKLTLKDSDYGWRVCKLVIGVMLIEAKP